MLENKFLYSLFAYTPCLSFSYQPHRKLLTLEDIKLSA